MHDPEEYEDPDEFRPERFIRDGKLDPNVRDPLAFVFGFGRRCVIRSSPSTISLQDRLREQDLPWTVLRRRCTFHQHCLGPACL